MGPSPWGSDPEPCQVDAQVQGARWSPKGLDPSPPPHGRLCTSWRPERPRTWFRRSSTIFPPLGRWAAHLPRFPILLGFLLSCPHSHSARRPKVTFRNRIISSDSRPRPILPSPLGLQGPGKSRWGIQAAPLPPLGYSYRQSFPDPVTCLASSSHLCHPTLGPPRRLLLGWHTQPQNPSHARPCFSSSALSGPWGPSCGFLR